MSSQPLRSEGLGRLLLNLPAGGSSKCDLERQPPIPYRNHSNYSIPTVPETQTSTVTIRIPTPLRSFTEGQASVEVHADTVDEALRTLVERYPDLAENLYSEDDELRHFVNVYLGDEDVRTREGTDTPVGPGDELSIVPSIAGG